MIQIQTSHLTLKHTSTEDLASDRLGVPHAFHHMSNFSVRALGCCSHAFRMAARCVVWRGMVRCSTRLSSVQHFKHPEEPMGEGSVRARRCGEMAPPGGY
ncbi:unnamed protein product [Leuciscus chuanchicus]